MCIIEPKTKTNKNDNSSLIFCLDKSRSMYSSYEIDRKLQTEFNEIRTSIFTYNITRLDMVKFSIEKIINSLLEEFII